MSDNKIVVSIDPDLEDLIPGFMENRSADVGKLQSALGDNDFSTIQSIGHNLKGVGGGYGFEKMSEIGAEIEIAAKDSNDARLAELITQLAEYLEQVDIVFE